jgi:hypothetical protein
MRRKAQLDYYQVKTDPIQPPLRILTIPFQWVPFLLVLQAVSYLLPELFWTTFSYFSGFHVGTLLEKAHKNTVNKESSKEKSKWAEIRVHTFSRNNFPLPEGALNLEEIDLMATQIHYALKAKYNAKTM